MPLPRRGNPAVQQASHGTSETANYGSTTVATKTVSLLLNVFLIPKTVFWKVTLLLATLRPGKQ